MPLPPSELRALAANVEPLAADHAERCIDELARDRAARIRERKPERLRE